MRKSLDSRFHGNDMQSIKLYASKFRSRLRADGLEPLALKARVVQFPSLLKYTSTEVRRRLDSNSFASRYV